MTEKTYTKAEIDAAVAAAVAGVNSKAAAISAAKAREEEIAATVARIAASDGPTQRQKHPDPEFEAVIARIIAA